MLGIMVVISNMEKCSMHVDRIFLASKIGSNDLSIKLKKEFEYGRYRENCVCAVSKNEPFAINGRASLHERSSNGDSPSLGSVHPSYDEVESNNNLHCLVRTGQQAMEVLDRQLQREVLFTYTSLIDAAEGKLEKAIEYLNMMVSRGCSPDIFTYNILFTALCKDVKVDVVVEILNQLSSKDCSQLLVTYNIMIDGFAKAGRTEAAIKLLDEMRRKGLQPDRITYTSLLPGLSREGKIDEAIRLFHKMEKLGIRPDAITYNCIMLGLCEARDTAHAIDFLAYMISRGCKLTEATYTILIQGLSHEGLAEEALELLNKLYARAVVKKSSAKQVVVKT
ncbi:hypothetical protein Cgig2_008386 [Carnegiea gigantea]|uniref:Pentatricopeptide repeat-containing protein n=1 Tax=Carnegiea gigantea TaxID=171969 RepID=A0A9Q1Q5K7_9CARY|nr:hypothetical protein Cgig2_008386 [Carnegiea gigantea]